MSELGYVDGEKCNRKGCEGTIELHPVENCSCHISPPCSGCTSPRAFCPVCDWEESEEQVINDYVVQVDRSTGVYKSWEPRPLDPTKIDYHNKSHTHFSMIKEGVYPPTANMADVEKEVRGTFGGRFEYFGNGRFKYIAYTD